MRVSGVYWCAGVSSTNCVRMEEVCEEERVERRSERQVSEKSKVW